ncbi:hypothetical protein HPP92_012000 [Vanilla planifolia]|uniref:Uncharacterized protein n=1 Tax=Vanilla planifolia TaxID=51239 RepID=A0A835R6W4_VANPL|nr:hypothetical protein HPP92_012000 [Vanilla planifolia]
MFLLEKHILAFKIRVQFFTRRFDADRIGSQVPVRLMHLEGLYELFVSKFALTSVDFSTNYFHISSTMRLTYRTPPFDDDDTEGSSIGKEKKMVLILMILRNNGIIVVLGLNGILLRILLKDLS